MITANGNILYSYTNGNCKVKIFNDGSKIREWPEGESAKPKHPESIDLKITNSCDAGCKMCHETSVINGKHGDTNNIIELMKSLPPGVEIAIGGGNPLDHPDLVKILLNARDAGLICNITVNGTHIVRQKHADLIKNLKDNKLIYGIGLSWTEECVIADDWFFENPDVVFHYILGIHSHEDIAESKKALILGYKTYGLGKENFKNNEKDIRKNIDRWNYFICGLLNNHKHLLFDNLAIKQLGLKEKLPEKIWNARYMGDDGKFTMYIDAVKMEYAISSIHPRQKLISLNIIEAFNSLDKNHTLV